MVDSIFNSIIIVQPIRGLYAVHLNLSIFATLFYLMKKKKIFCSWLAKPFWMKFSFSLTMVERALWNDPYNCPLSTTTIIYSNLTKNSLANDVKLTLASLSRTNMSHKTLVKVLFLVFFISIHFSIQFITLKFVVIAT